MHFIAFFLLFAQTNSPINANKPTIAVTVDGYAESMIEAAEYEIILYADVDDKVEKTVKKEAQDLLAQIKKVVKSIGGKDSDVIITNSNTYEPIEGDPYYRIEQDVKISVKDVDDIDAIKGKFLEIDGVQIGSAAPIIPKDVDYTETISKARENAVSKAAEEAAALAKAFKVVLGEPLFITESIIYPYYDEYSATDSNRLTVKLTVYYEMIYRK